MLAKNSGPLSLRYAAIVAMAGSLGCYSDPFPHVDRATLSFDTVRRGSMTRDVSGPGTLEFSQASDLRATAAHVAQRGRLVAVLRVPEGQVDEIRPGLAATLDLHSVFLNGRVTHTDSSTTPSVALIEVAIQDPLPSNAHAGLTVDGTSSLERLSDVLFVARPGFGGPGSGVGMFRVIPNAGDAERVTVQLGRAGINAIEISAGARAGDSLIMNDVSQFDYTNKIRISERGDMSPVRTAAAVVSARTRATVRGWVR